jgi:hypothetical protein
MNIIENYAINTKTSSQVSRGFFFSQKLNMSFYCIKNILYKKNPPCNINFFLVLRGNNIV